MYANIGTIVNVEMEGNEVQVTLTGIPDNQRVTVMLNNFKLAGPAYPVSMGFLVGDVTNSPTVNAGDISATRAHSGQVTNCGNFRFDINTRGSINAQDVSMVKARAGLMLP